MQRGFEEFASHCEIRIKYGDQAPFYKHLKRMDLESRISCSVQSIKDEQGKLLRDTGLICDRWVQRFSTLQNTKSPALDLNIVEELKGVPPCISLHDLPSTVEVEDTIKIMSN